MIFRRKLDLMYELLSAINLTTTTAAIVIWALCVLALVIGAVVAWRKHPARTRRALIVALILVGLVVFAFTVWPNPYPGEVPLTLLLSALSPIALLLFLCVIKGRRWVMAILLAIALASTYLVGNLSYRQVENLGAVMANPSVESMSYQEFQSLTSAPTRGGREIGALVEIPFAGPESKFQARDALAYVPPAYWSDPHTDLPVLVLLPGTPGNPRVWFTSGDGVNTLDAYQRDHGGKSPIVISVDGTGSELGNPACVDGPKDKVQTYLSVDVPALIKQHFRVDQNQQHWTIGGLSYGGTCALTTVTNHPDAYGSFLNFSGEARPNNGSHASTVAELFGGSEEAFNMIDPAHILTKAAASSAPTFDHIAGWFISGADEPKTGAVLDHLAQLSRKAGMTVHAGVVPGGHDYQTWRAALAMTIDFVATRGQL